MGIESFREAVWEHVPPDALPESLAPRRAFLLAHVEPGDRVLDLGCGDGTFSAALLEAGAQVTALDAAHAALDRARRRVPGLDARHWSDGEPLPVEDGTADVAWAGEVLEHLVDPAPWLSEVRRALRAGGTLLVTTPDHGRRTLLRLAASPRRFAEHFEPRGDHLRFFNATSLRGVLDDLGFDVQQIRRRHGTLFVRAHRA